jgi:hypothetical protein
MILEVLIVTNTKITVSWDVMLCGVVEELTASIFRVEETSPKMGAAGSSKCCFLSAIVDGITSQET